MPVLATLGALISIALWTPVPLFATLAAELLLFSVLYACLRWHFGDMKLDKAQVEQHIGFYSTDAESDAEMKV